MFTKRYASIALAAAVATLAACEPRDDRAATTDTGIAGTQTQAGAVQQRDFREAGNVTSFMQATNAIEIQSAELAQERAQNQQVRQFAQQLRQDHTQARERVANFMQQHTIAAPDDMGNVEDVVGTRRDAMDDIRNAQGPDFDRRWLEMQVDLHERAIQASDDAVQQTQHAELRTLLQEMRPQLMQHLQRAQQLHDQVGRTGTTTGTTGTTGTTP